MEHFITTQISQHGYLAIFVLMTLESMCIPIPSEAIMGLGGALTAGVTIAGVTGRLDIWLVILLGTFGNLVGSLIAYWVGKSGGHTLVERYGKYALLRHHDLDKAEAFFAKHGESAVFVSRILPVVRTFISFPAGVAEMPMMKFALFTLLGSLPWAIGLAYAGRALATNWDVVSKVGTPISIVFVLVIFVVTVRWYLRRRKNAAA